MGRSHRLNDSVYQANGVMANLINLLSDLQSRGGGIRPKGKRRKDSCLLMRVGEHTYRSTVSLLLFG